MQTSAIRHSISLSVPCTTLLSLPTFPSQGLGFFPGHHVLPGCPDITSALSHIRTTPVQAISSLNYSVNSFLSVGSFHPYALGRTEEYEKEKGIEEWASKINENHWGGWETVVQS